MSVNLIPVKVGYPRGYYAQTQWNDLNKIVSKYDNHAGFWLSMVKDGDTIPDDVCERVAAAIEAAAKTVSNPHEKAWLDQQVPLWATSGGYKVSGALYSAPFMGKPL